MTDARHSPIVDAIEDLESAGAAPGTAGTPSSEVLSVQGVSGGTAIRILPLSPTSSTGSITAGSQTVQHALAGTESSVTLVMYGTFSSLQVAFEYTPDNGTNWGACLGYYQGVSNAVSGQTSYAAISATASAVPAYTIAVPAGATHVRIRSISLASGTVNVKMTSDPLTRPVTGLQQVVIGNSAGSSFSLSSGPSDTNSQSANFMMSMVFGMSFGGAILGNWARNRYPNIIKTATATGSGDTALWTPTSGRKFNLLGGYIQVPAGATSASADVDILLRDSTTALGVGATVSLPSSAPTLSGAGGALIPFNLGPVGVMSSTINNVLNINLSAALTASKVRVVVWGTEE